MAVGDMDSNGNPQDSPPPPAQKRDTPGLFSELKRRKVFRSAGAYLVVAWLILQVASILLPTFGVPAWGMRMVVIMLATGFPLVVLLAWVYELSPDGVRRTLSAEEESNDPSLPENSLRRNLAAFGLGAAIPTTVFMVFLLIVVFLPGDGDPGKRGSEIGIAVLPFTNLTSDEANGFFSAGMYDDLLTQLSRIGDLAVASKSAVRYYSGDAPDLALIAEELQVQYIVEGSVQRDGDDLRVSVQLTEVASDRHVWAENFDRRMENIFALQSEISREIARHVKARLSPEDEAVLKQVPTEVVAAYDAYLRARNPLVGFWVGFDVLAESQKQLEFATMADPEFVEAWAMLAVVHSRRYMQLFNMDQKQPAVAEAAEAARAALDRARQLDPENLSTLRAEGFHAFIVTNDFMLGSRSLDKALQLVPNDTESMSMLAYCYRRLGQIDKAIEILEEIYAVAPDEPFVFGSLISNLHDTAQYSRLIPIYDRALKRFPERSHYILEKLYYTFLVSGSIDDFRAYEKALQEIPITESCDPASWRRGRMTVAMLNGEFDAYAEDWKIKWENHHRGHGDWVCPLQVNEEANHAALLLLQGRESEAQEILTESFHNITLPTNPLAACTFDTAMIRPKLHYMMNNRQAARDDLDYAIRKLESKPDSLLKFIEKAVLVEAADMIAPDLAYSLFLDIQQDTIRMVTLEIVCANPWSYPHLMDNPKFQKQVLADGRYVEFLRTFGFHLDKAT